MLLAKLGKTGEKTLWQQGLRGSLEKNVE